MNHRWALAVCTFIVVNALGSCRAEEEPRQPVEAPWTDPAPHRSDFVTVNGVRLHYLDWDGSKPALILIHGHGDNAHVFDDLAPAFTDRFRVVAYTRRGHGRSEAKGPYDTATLVEDLRQLMDSLGITRASLVGWSMGGNEITGMAGAHPDRVDRIVYFDAGYDWGDPAFVASLDSLPVSVTPPPEALRSLAAFRTWHTSTWHPAVTEADRIEAYVQDQVEVQADGSVRTALRDSVGQAFFGTLLTDRRDYTRVKAPALVIYTESFFDLDHPDSIQRASNLRWEQKYFVPFRVASVERIRRELRNAEIVTVPGTHAEFVFTSRDRVVEAIRRFLLAEAK